MSRIGSFQLCLLAALARAQAVEICSARRAQHHRFPKETTGQSRSTMSRIGSLQLCLLAALALAQVATGAHISEEPASDAATHAQQIMRSEGPRAQAQGSLADQGAEQDSARIGARVVPGAADPPLDAGIKLSYPSYPFFGSVVVVGEEGTPASASQPVPAAYSGQPVSSGYPSQAYSSQPAAYPSYAPAAPAPYPSYAPAAPAPAPRLLEEKAGSGSGVMRVQISASGESENVELETTTTSTTTTTTPTTTSTTTTKKKKKSNAFVGKPCWALFLTTLLGHFATMD